MTSCMYERQLQELYRLCPGRSWPNDLEHYLRHGYVFASPTHLLIGERIGDGWHIHVAIGTGCLKKFCELMPYWLPYVGWAREHRAKRSEIRWHRTETIFRKVGYVYGRINAEAPAAPVNSGQERSGTKCSG